jgi:hypothetical protein
MTDPEPFFATMCRYDSNGLHQCKSRELTEQGALLLLLSLFLSLFSLSSLFPVCVSLSSYTNVDNNGESFEQQQYVKGLVEASGAWLGTALQVRRHAGPLKFKRETSNGNLRKLTPKKRNQQKRIASAAARKDSTQKPASFVQSRRLLSTRGFAWRSALDKRLQTNVRKITKVKGLYGVATRNHEPESLQGPEEIFGFFDVDGDGCVNATEAFMSEEEYAMIPGTVEGCLDFQEASLTVLSPQPRFHDFDLDGDECMTEMEMEVSASGFDSWQGSDDGCISRQEFYDTLGITSLRIRDEPCPMEYVIIIDHEGCVEGEPHFDPEGAVCGNDGTAGQK